MRLISCERVVLSDSNALAWLTTDDGVIIAKWSVRAGLFERLAEVAELTGWLGSRGLPVSAPVRALDGTRQVEVDDVSIGLQRAMPGALLDVTDAHQVYAAGATLAELHQALADYPGKQQPEPEPLPDRVTSWLESVVPGRQLPGVAQLGERLQALRSSRPALPAQLVHNDFRSANVLWSNDSVSAVLDFEEATYDYCVADLANSAVLLGTQYHNWGPVSQESRHTLVAGYRSVRPLSQAEEDWLRVLILWRTLCAVPAGGDPAGWARSAEHQLAETWPPATSQPEPASP